MPEELFDIVFKGELVRSFEPDAVKKNIGQLFKVDGAKLEALFSGKSVVLKRNLDFDTAAKYRGAIKKAGAVVALVPVENVAAQPQPAPLASQTAPPQQPASSTRAVFGERVSALQNPSSHSAHSEPASSLAPAQASPVSSSYVRPETYDMSLAPAGLEILASSERKPVEVVAVDISSISLREGGGDLLDESEKTIAETLDIDLSAIQLAPQGELLKPHERKQVEAVKVDITRISLAEPGARLGQPSPPPPPPPDVSKIKLAP